MSTTMHKRASIGFLTALFLLASMLPAILGTAGAPAFAQNPEPPVTSPESLIQVFSEGSERVRGEIGSLRSDVTEKKKELAETEKLVAAERKEAAQNAAWMFALDADFSDFQAAARWERKLARVKKEALGRVLRSPTLFEDVVKTILTTNTLWGATKRMNLNLINLFGEPLLNHRPPERASGLRERSGAQSKGETTAITKTTATTETKRAFPTPESIAASSPEEIKEKVRVGYRASALHELAVRVASGELDLEALKTSSLPTLELRKELIKIKGVGPYAAANLLLILGRPDFIPIDSWALKLVSNEWYRGKPITAKEVEKRFEKWGEFKGFAFWFWEWKEDG